MRAVVGIRELSQKLSELEKYDYIEVEDKKTKKPKGIFISDKYAKEFKEFLEQKKKKEIEKKLEELKKFAGNVKIKEQFLHLNSNKEIRELIAKEKYGK